MRYSGVVLLFVVALAGCDRLGGTEDAASTPTLASTAPVATTPVEVAPAPNLNNFDTPLPEGVVLKIAHHPTRDVVVPKSGGKNGRRVEFEILEGDPATAIASIAASMTEAGFKIHSGPTQEGAIIRQSFAKAGYGIVNVRAQAERQKGFQNPEAKGFVAMAW